MISRMTLRFFVLSAAIAFTAALPLQAQLQKPSPQTAERIKRIEANLASIPNGRGQPSLQFDLPTIMQTLHMPGLSIAVIDNFQIAWAKGYGFADPDAKTPVTAHTLFQAASISKTVAATAALKLVEQGKLSLDEDVNTKLTSWKVPENEFTKNQKVTLRRIVSHNAGLTVHGFPGYATDAPIPTLLQVLNGEKPANTAPIRVDVVPGTVSRYSGGGVTIEQQLMLDVTGEPFPQFMRETVLDKIGMTDSTFEQPLPAARASQAASATNDGKVIHGKWHVYPEIAAAGLWTTPTDLAKFAIEIALSKQGKSNRILSEKMTREMLTPQFGQIGLAFFLDQHNPGQFGHDGGNEGFQSILLMLGDSGQGVVIMSNSDSLYRMEGYLIEAVAREYSWKYSPPKRPAGNVLAIVAAAKGGHAAIQTYSELKTTASAAYTFEEGDLNEFGYHQLMLKKTDEALEAFKLNVEQYPQSWNVYDSLAEAYMGVGQTDLAIQNYEKSLELNPKNKNGAAMLEKLKSQKK